MTLSPELEKAIEEAANHVYATAVAVHESIVAGRGATGYREAEVQGYLLTLVKTVLKEACRAECPSCRKDIPLRPGTEGDVAEWIHVWPDGSEFPCQAEDIRALLPGEEE